MNNKRDTRQCPTHLDDSQLQHATRGLNSKTLRTYQAKLTSTAKELMRLTTGFSVASEMLTWEQREMLLSAAKLVKNISQQIVHAKEKTQRAEKAAEKARMQRQEMARRLVGDEYPLDAKTHETQREIMELALVLSHLNLLSRYCFGYLLLPAQPDRRNQNDLQRNINLLRGDIRLAIQDHLAQAEIELQPALISLQERCACAYPEVMAKETKAMQAWLALIASSEGA